jgi:NADPH:quinone reductase-like Zn-dependent oxidoreductase
MKAIIQDTYGSPDVLELKDIERPEVGDDEVLYEFTRLPSIQMSGTS